MRSRTKARASRRTNSADLDRFYSDRPQTDAKRGKNSGLGLSISREIVVSHNGEIFAENRAPNGAQPTRGARFTVRLPLSAANRNRTCLEKLSAFTRLPLPLATVRCWSVDRPDRESPISPSGAWASDHPHSSRNDKTGVGRPSPAKARELLPASECPASAARGSLKFEASASLEVDAVTEANIVLVADLVSEGPIERFPDPWPYAEFWALTCPWSASCRSRARAP